MVSLGSAAKLVGLAAGAIIIFQALRNARPIGQFIGSTIGGGISNVGQGFRDSFLSGLQPLGDDFNRFFTDTGNTINESLASTQGALEGAGVIPAAFAEESESQTPRPSLPKFKVPKLSNFSFSSVLGRINSRTPFEVKGRFPRGNLPQFVSQVEFRSTGGRVRRAFESGDFSSERNLRGEGIRVSNSTRQRLIERGYIVS